MKRTFPLSVWIISNFLILLVSTSINICWFDNSKGVLCKQNAEKILDSSWITTNKSRIILDKTRRKSNLKKFLYFHNRTLSKSPTYMLYKRVAVLFKDPTSNEKTEHMGRVVCHKRNIAGFSIRFNDGDIWDLPYQAINQETIRILKYADLKEFIWKDQDLSAIWGKRFRYTC
eukprot:TRINITY_DN245_c1_g1_i6.p1 TRINITY_DN245_c1_g1~~TRINITY_DN245_c1_g1_i6.p1  ORF type:complete len:173 (+),score=16.03 TRINITY_DN245_c1_g1_i6:532-1050(+)